MTDEYDVVYAIEDLINEIVSSKMGNDDSYVGMSRDYLIKTLRQFKEEFNA